MAGSKKEYQRLVRNAKAKMKRVKDKFGLDLSYEIDIPDYDEFNTPEEFDEWVDHITSFTDRGNKDYQFKKNKKGVVYSQAELEHALEVTKQAQDNATEFIEKFKDLPIYADGKEMGYTVGDKMTLYNEPNVGGITVPKDFNIDVFETRGRLETRIENLEEKADGVFFDRTMRQMQRNFIKMIKVSFNSVADDLVDMMEIIPEDDFYELFLMNDAFSFEHYASDGSVDGTEEQAELLRGYLMEYFRGNVDMSLKGF